MKRTLVIVFLCLLFSQNTFASGAGEIILTDKVVWNFERYLKFKKPVVFLVTVDGKDSIGWRCPHNECVPTGAMNEIKLCEREFGKKCFVFAKRRTIKWNSTKSAAAKRKDKKFSSKDSLNEIKTKLTKLGLY